MKSIVFFLIPLLSRFSRVSSRVAPARLDYTTVVTFGDATSDTGNAYRLSNRTWPPVPPFNANGSFADARLWNQIVTDQFLNNASLEDFAYESATTDSQLVQGTMGRNPNLLANYALRNSTRAPGVRQQIIQYISSKADQEIDLDRILYVVTVGFNNYQFNRSLTPSDTVQSIVDCLNRLIFFGARNLLVMNQFPYDRFPKYRNRTTTNATKALYAKHNELLAEKMNENYLSSNTRLRIRLFDSYALVTNILNNYMAYGFENLDPCWNTESGASVIVQCENISRRVFTDEYHLSSAVHALMARQVYSALGEFNATARGVRTMTPNLCLVVLLILSIVDRRATNMVS